MEATTIILTALITLLWVALGLRVYLDRKSYDVNFETVFGRKYYCRLTPLFVNFLSFVCAGALISDLINPLKNITISDIKWIPIHILVIGVIWYQSNVIRNYKKNLKNDTNN